MRGFQELGHLGLVALRHVRSSWTRDQTCVSCTGRRILYHGVTREAPILPDSFSWLLCAEEVTPVSAAGLVDGALCRLPWTGHSSHQLSVFVLEACDTQWGLQKLDLVGPVLGSLQSMRENRPFLDISTV